MRRGGPSSTRVRPIAWPRTSTACSPRSTTAVSPALSVSTRSARRARVRLHHPRAADADDVRQRQIVRRVSRRDPAGRAEAHLRERPANAFSALTPPTTSAGKSFAWVIPRSSSATRSDAVAAPGRNGTPLACSASSSVGVAPGETRKRAPAAQRLGDLRGVVTVPGADDRARRPRRRSARSPRARRGVRSVTSIAGSPPRDQRAAASGTASSRSSITTTGMTGASPAMFDGERVSMAVMRSPPDGCEALKTDAPVVGAADALAEGGEQLAAGAVGGGLGDPRLARPRGRRRPRAGRSRRPRARRRRRAARDERAAAAASGVQWIAAGTLPGRAATCGRR